MNDGTQAGVAKATGPRGVVAVSSLCVGMGAALGFAPGFMATELGNDLDISRGQVGLVVSLYFGCTGLGSIGGGRMTEKLGARAVVVLDMVLVAGAALLTAVAGTYWSLIVAAVVAGTAYSLVNAGTNVAIGRAVEPGRRTTAMSVKTAGVPLMAVVGAALGPWAADRWSWRLIMVVISVVAAGSAIAAGAILANDRPT
ncbi:MAG: MFS transporter, partial [Acidimicrobiia bacterium]